MVRVTSFCGSGRGTIAAIIQASLWDAVTLLAGYPALETPGYFRMSLRDKRLTKTYASFAPLGLAPFSGCLATACAHSTGSGQAVGCNLSPPIDSLRAGFAAGVWGLCGFFLALRLWHGFGRHSFSFGTLFRSCLVRSDMGFDGAGDGCGALGAGLGAGLEKMPGFAMGFMFVVFLVRGEYNHSFPNQFFRGEEIPDIVGHDVDGEVVNLRRGVGTLMGGMEEAGVCRPRPAVGAFDLDAQEASVVFDGNVVAGGVAPGLRNVEPAFRRMGHE